VSGDQFSYALRIGDDALILSHRLAEWSSKAPQLEDDIALTNIALDLLGQARSFLTYAGKLEGENRDEDDFAYLRGEEEFRCCLLVEQPNNDDFGLAIARLLLFSNYQLALYGALSVSSDEMFAAIAGKAINEVSYHRDYAMSWTVRLGDGTHESHERMQKSLNDLWRFTGELFEADEVISRLVSADIAPDPDLLKAEWDRDVDATLTQATLERPTSNVLPGTGRSGRHSEHLGYLLAEMQYLHRLHPGATW
jgi:ring-1,2-phenylacetyl-CoA epoxidase subunit PaaC